MRRQRQLYTIGKMVETGLLFTGRLWIKLILLMQLKLRHNLYDPAIVTRMAHLWGTEADGMLSAGLGANMGGLFEAELQHMRDREWATTAEDVLWRRTKMGLHMDAAGQAKVRAFFGGPA